MSAVANFSKNFSKKYGQM